MNTQTKQNEATYTLADVGCYVDGARGIYAIDAIARFSLRHGHALDDETAKDIGNLSASEFAGEIEDEINDYMNENYPVENAYWGRNENGDWGLWQDDDPESYE